MIAALATAALALAPEPTGQVLGAYTQGRLAGAAALPADGPGFVHLFGERNRQFGSEGLVRLLEGIAGAMTDAFPGGERLQLGDLSAEHGGRVNGHVSHQNGLDADGAFFRANRREQPGDVDGFPESFVSRGRVTANFDLERNWALFQGLVASGRVGRIFVDGAIKGALCDLARLDTRASRLDRGLSEEQPRDTAETLRALRPYPNHDNHFHVRLTCPTESPRCVPQEPPPQGPGCDAKSLATVHPSDLALAP